MSLEGEAELEEVQELEAREATRGRARDISTLGQRSALNFVGGALFGLFSFVSLVIVARGLGPQRSGAFFEGVAFFTIATSLVVLGFDESRERVDLLLTRAHDEVRSLLAEHRHVVEALRDALLERNELVDDDIIDVIKSAQPSTPASSI